MFNRYAATSGQVVNPSKSTIYAGALSTQRIASIASLLGFSIGTLPFLYLGISIFKGKPKDSFLQPIADRIKTKLSAWKASLMSIAGKVQLVRSVIQKPQGKQWIQNPPAEIEKKEPQVVKSTYVPPEDMLQKSPKKGNDKMIKERTHKLMSLVDDEVQWTKVLSVGKERGKGVQIASNSGYE
ncbi:unnamed protein product [Vicia faba]|uniref:Uncharacterized protein n=1 Tax=Vicia faba TaxID=3906 RepID=A0AAV1APR2_VICFA|nr:unnamed protein product [Vicia faba]